MPGCSLFDSATSTETKLTVQPVVPLSFGISNVIQVFNHLFLCSGGVKGDQQTHNFNIWWQN